MSLFFLEISFYCLSFKAMRIEGPTSNIVCLFLALPLVNFAKKILKKNRKN